jgi:undecaprenyl-diphosphatase
MNSFEGFILGVIQGLTEFLPVSSSGHLVITQNLLSSLTPSLAFNIIVHLATLLAVLIYFRKHCLNLLKPPFHIPTLIIIASVPTAIIGLLGKSYIESSLENPLFSAGALVINGFLLLLSRPLFKTGKGFERGTLFQIKLSKKTVVMALLIGVAQGIAIIPGISRSGLTIVTALFLGFTALQAFEFSFLISIPAVFGAFLLELGDLSALTLTPSIYIGFLMAFVTGLAALYIIKDSLSKGYFPLFGYYCILVGGGLLLWL